MVSSSASIISFVVALIFGIVGLHISKLQIGSRSSYSLDWFLTARNSQSWLNVGFALLATSISAWLFFPYFPYDEEVALSTQLIILFLYSLAASYPIVLMAHVGDIMKTKYPTIRSVTDYARLRFGKPVAIYVSCTCIINGGIGLITEFTHLGRLYGIFSSCQTFPVALIALSSLFFITFGGLPVALTINRYQLTIVMILIIILFSYVLSMIDFQLLKQSSEGVNLTAPRISLLLAIGFAKPSCLFFFDGFWHRILAAESRDALRKGSWLGAFLTMCFIFSIRLMGYLEFSSGLTTDSHLSFIGLFVDGPEWAAILLMISGVLMSQGMILICIHSVTASVTSLLSILGFKDSISSTRMISIFIHIPLIVIGIIAVDNRNLFLIANILTTSSVLPLLLGLAPRLDCVNGSSVLMGCAFSLISVFVFGYISTGCVLNGIFRYLFDEYSWQSQIVALSTSLIGVALCVLIEIGLYTCAGQPYVPDIKLNGYILPDHSYQSMDTVNHK